MAECSTVWQWHGCAVKCMRVAEHDSAHQTQVNGASVIWGSLKSCSATKELGDGKVAVAVCSEPEGHPKQHKYVVVDADTWGSILWSTS